MSRQQQSKKRAIEKVDSSVPKTKNTPSKKQKHTEAEREAISSQLVDFSRILEGIVKQKRGAMRNNQWRPYCIRSCAKLSTLDKIFGTQRETFEFELSFEAEGQDEIPTSKTGVTFFKDYPMGSGDTYVFQELWKRGVVKHVLITVPPLEEHEQITVGVKASCPLWVRTLMVDIEMSFYQTMCTAEEPISGVLATNTFLGRMHDKKHKEPTREDLLQFWASVHASRHCFDGLGDTKPCKHQKDLYEHLEKKPVDTVKLPFNRYVEHQLAMLFGVDLNPAPKVTEAEEKTIQTVERS